MKYIINTLGELAIRNDSGYPIFGISKYKHWYKNEYDQHCNRIYYEDYRGIKLNHNHGI